MDNMKVTPLIEKELKIRELFTWLIRKKGYEEALLYGDIFTFFGINQEFDLKQLRSFWQEHVDHVKMTDHHMCLYIHIPFCRKKCTYCSLSNWMYAGESQLDHYVDYLISEMEIFNDIFKDVQFQNFQFRGGTANLLTDQQLRRLFQAVHERFSFSDRAQFTCECNPYESTRETLKIFHDFGFRRISFGVQSADQEVLKCANRGYQNFDDVQSVISSVRGFSGFEWINADLLIGLYNDSPVKVYESFCRLSDLRVESISVYPLSLTHYYFKRYYQGKKDVFDAELERKLRDFEALVTPAAQKAGYQFFSLKELTPDHQFWQFLRSDALEAKENIPDYKTRDVIFDCLGLGVGSWSIMANRIYYREFDALSRRPGSAEKRYEGLFLSDRWGKTAHVFRDLGLVQWNRLSLKHYQQKFGAAFCDDFKETVERLQQIGAVRIEDDMLYLIPRNVDEKFTALLFFVDTPMILRELEHPIPSA